ncbi:LysR family transcriptional regulator [Ferrovum sp. PN-J185]|uniref:LysR family transcriptional regulator n=1 Tax=Ferrovum sp. PN-J185 TaxID=1356306 RepID=UPI00079CCED9|nr:LysR family transcriptional regulator [Ferrovum sp. PN-J185]KXW56324.1 HTH-type transcriptional activator CmpR [Ferrovum sp. PN-J185]MCC6069048.1 LysR family transcriptional regulator [Ferrovum sp. PN-J185]MDE1890972.1 LysR family transcriptional regulator [Betaproteobacteria bacterium]MDE2055716.1 LysR family transcriptional regulator [Betaproteobacteria bacterium]
MRHATLRQLKVFETVARRLSFSRAAEELHLSQPAVSTQIRQLENHAGVPLFEQLGKKIYLTQAGETMLKHCRLIINQFREAEEAMDVFKGVSSGTLNVGVNSAADYFFPHILAEFKNQVEQAKIQLTVVNRDSLVQKLSDNEIDLIIMCRPPHEIEVIAEKFAPHPYVIIARPDHPLANKKNIALEELFDYPFITRETGSDTRDAISEKFKDQVTNLDIALAVQSTETIKQAVRSGMGLAFISAFNINLEIELNHLTILDVAGFPAMRHWYIIYRKEKLLPPITQAFIGFLHERGATLINDFTPLKRANVVTDLFLENSLSVSETF